VLNALPYDKTFQNHSPKSAARPPRTAASIAKSGGRA
jgi:hypothetical protein